MKITRFMLVASSHSFQGREGEMMPEKDSLIMQREAGASPLAHDGEKKKENYSCYTGIIFAHNSRKVKVHLAYCT